MNSEPSMAASQVERLVGRFFVLFVYCLLLFPSLFVLLTVRSMA